MAIPKIFISSTCYDLKQIRNDLYNFIESYGYQAVLSEKNTVPYNTTDDLESDCYAEINNCDIVVGILGGAFRLRIPNSGRAFGIDEGDRECHRQ